MIFIGADRLRRGRGCKTALEMERCSAWPSLKPFIRSAWLQNLSRGARAPSSIFA